MVELLTRLKQRKLVQWAIAWIAFAFALLQGLDIVAQRFNWPAAIERYLILALAIGFFVVLVLAWYHGERGAQRAGSMEIMILALLLAIGGGLIWSFGPTATHRTRALHMHSAHADAVVAEAATTIATQAANIAGAHPIPAKSVAVLPFENLSNDKGNAYFADGMQDLILTKLADIGDLKVISRTSTESYGSHPGNLKVIAQQLGVATILEGSVQKAGNQVLINVQLIDVDTDSHIWAQSYQRTLDNIFGVEGEVAEKIAGALNAKLTPTEVTAVAQIPTHNKQAYDAYLKATYYLNDFNRTGAPGENARAVALLSQAVQWDPAFREAYSALALVYMHQGHHLVAAEGAVAHALALDPNDANAHRMMAYVLGRKGEIDRAIEQARQAVRLRPGTAVLWNGLGNVYLGGGRFDKAETAYRRAIALDPKPDSNGWAQLNLTLVLLAQRRYGVARDLAQWVATRDPENVTAATQLAEINEYGWGDLDAARKALQGVPTPVASSGALSDAWYWLDLYARDYQDAQDVIAHAPEPWFNDERFPLALYLAMAYQARGDTVHAKAAFSEARPQLEVWIKASPDAAYQHAELALVLAGLGERDQALREAQRAVALQPVGKYGLDGTSQVANLAAVDARIGRSDAAVKHLDGLLATASGLAVSLPMLELDPAWDPIRHDPGFQALLKKYAKDQPTTVSRIAPAASSAGATP